MNWTFHHQREVGGLYVTYPEGNLWRSKVDGSETQQLTFTTLGILRRSPRSYPDGKQIVFMGRNPGIGWRIYLDVCSRRE